MSDDSGDAIRAHDQRLIDPIELARRDLKKALPRRFYTSVEVGETADGFTVLLDGKPVRTPAKAPLVVPTAGLAAAIAAEWQAVTEIIEPDAMPVTRLVNTAIDGVARTMAETTAEVVKFGDSDLVCYRAGDPAALVAEQAALWDPVLAFARNDLGATFVCAEGIMFVEQPPPARAAVGEAVGRIADGPNGPLRLAALSLMTNLTGSVLIALAVISDRLTAEAAWTAAHVDEDFQMRSWGVDAEAMERRERRWRDMKSAASVADLCADPARAS